MATLIVNDCGSITLASGDHFFIKSAGRTIMEHLAKVARAATELPLASAY